VAFYWIPAHLNVPGNEMADDAAKRATGWRNNAPPGPPAARLADIPRQGLRSSAGAVVQRYKGLSAPQASTLFQARTGKIGLNHFLTTIRKQEDPLCPCGQAEETVAHILLRCTRY
ncbi:hypothetical protein P170DRAFT_313443, partial [Aspergillus steynii IBT 23096]